MSEDEKITKTATRKTFEVRPSQPPVDYLKLIGVAIKRFPKVHAVLSK